MALSFDAFSADATALPAQNQNWNHTCTGQNRILIVFIGSGGTTGDTVTGVTYNSVAMTRIATGVSSDVRVWGYYLLNPTAGSNAVAVSTSASGFYRNLAVSYAGATQGSQPDNHNENGVAPGTSVQTTLTTVADNCWNISFVVGASGTITASTNVNSVRGNRDAVVYVGDSNAPLTPASGYSMIWTAGSQNLEAIQVSISPAPIVIAANIRGSAFFL